MVILYLGPECCLIESCLIRAGHSIIRIEHAFDTDFLVRNEIDFGISYKYRHIIRNAEIEWFQGRLINLHISLLPYGRGADPNIWSYLENTPNGVTIHRIDSGIDTGPVLVQKAVSMDFDHDTLKTSYIKLSQAVEILFVANSDRLLNGSIEGKIQPCNEGTFHHSNDKEQYACLWAEKGWDTPVSSLLGKAR